MTQDRRVPEASALRGFFDEQWAQISTRFEAWQRKAAAQGRRRARTDAALEEVVDGTSARVRMIGGYRRRLRDGVRSVLVHVESLMSRLPKSANCSARRFGHDPHLNAFFVNRHHIGEVFGASRPLRAFLDQPGRAELKEVYCLLLMTRQERSVLGMAMVDGVPTPDVPQTTVSFAGHEVLYPSPEEPDLRSNVERHLFETIVRLIQLRLVRQINADDTTPPADDGPGAYLDQLVAVLGSPEELLRLDRTELRLNRVGIKLEGDRDEGRVNQLTLNELVTGEASRRILVLARYPPDELPPEADLLSP